MMWRAVVLVLLLLAACGGAADEAPELDPNAMPEIIALSAESSVLAGQSTTIAYEVKNARAIEISVGDRTVLSTLESMGSVDSGALRHNALVTLTARKGDQVAIASRMIAVVWDAPVIESFTAPPRALMNETTQLSWRARNVDVLRVLRAGDEVFRTADAEGTARVGVGSER